MSTRCSTTSLFFIFAAFLFPLGCPFGSSAAWAQGYNWYARAEALFLHRDDPESLDIIQDDFLPGEPAVLTSRTAEFDFEPGFRFTAGRQFDSNCAIEASYFGLYDWSASAAVTSAAPGLDSLETADSFFPNTSPFLIFFTDFDTAAVTAETEVHNFQVDLRRRYTPVFTFVAGFEYIHVNDNFNILTAEVDAPPNIGQRRYDTNAKSNLFGMHFGGELAYELGRRWTFVGKGSAGIFLGQYEQEERNYALTDIEDPILGTIPAGTVFFVVSDEAIGMASSVELGTTAVCALTSNVNFRIGYELIVWSGLALAPEQLNDSLVGNETHRDGIMVLNGATIGLDVTY